MNQPKASVGRNASYNLAGSIVPLLLSLLTVPLYLAAIGPDRYGVLAIAWLLLGYFGLFDLGLGRATSYQIASLRDAAPSTRATTLWTAALANVGIGLVGAGILFVASDWFFRELFQVPGSIRQEVVASAPYLALSVPVATLTGVLVGSLQGREKFLQTNAVSVGSTVLVQLAPLAVAWLHGPYVPHLLIAALLARLVSLIALSVMCHLELTRGHPVRFDRKSFRALLGFGGWETITALFGPLLVISDRFAIGSILGSTAVTLYSVPMQLAQRISVLPGALVGALFPRLSASGPGEERRLGKLAARTMAALMTLPVLFAILAAEPFLRLWVGDDIGGQAAPLARILLIGFWVNAFALVPYTRLQARGRPDLVAKTLLSQVPFYLAALVAAMQLFGLIGCAIVFAARCLVDYVVLSLVLERRVADVGGFFANGLILIAGCALAPSLVRIDGVSLALALILALAAAGLALLTVPRELVGTRLEALMGRWPLRRVSP